MPYFDGRWVKVVDVSWISQTRLKRIGSRVCLTKAPEICVEVLSPSNSRQEIREKRALFFAAGADEFWTCDSAGKLVFYLKANGPAAAKSQVCPDFPVRLTA